MAAPQKSSRRPPRRPTRHHVVLEAPHSGPIIWSNFSWKWFLGIASGIGILAGAIVAWDKAHPIVEPWMPASSGYVREYSNETATKKVEPIAKRFEDYEAFKIEQTLEIAKLNLNTTNSNLDFARKEVEMYPNSVAARESLARLTKLASDTRKRIEDYEAALFARRSGGK